MILDQAQRTSAEKESSLTSSDPKDVKLLVQRGWLLAALQDQGAAQADFEKAVAEQPEHAEAHSGLGYVLACRKKGAEARREANLALLHGGGDYLILHNVACIYGELSAADRIYERGCAKGLADCSKLKIVWQSPPIWNDPVLYRTTLSEDMKKKIRDAFYSVKNLPFGEMGTVARFDPITDKDYDPLRDIAKTLNLDLTKMK